MPNDLGYWNETLFSQISLIQLEKALGLGNRVHKDYDAERKAFNKGDTINIRRPGTFTAQDAPSSPQDLDPDSVQMTFAYWKEVKFALTDKELAYSTDRIIREHIRPAAVALADFIDQTIAGLYVDVPWAVSLNTTNHEKDFPLIQKTMFDNKVPLKDGPDSMHYMLNGHRQQRYLEALAFTQQQGAGDLGINTQVTGSLGVKYGFETFANQNTPSHTEGTAPSGDAAGTLAAGTVAKGLETITIEALTNAETVKKGDTFSIAGDTQRYAFAEDGTVASNALTNISITPKLATTYSAGAVVTLYPQAAAPQCLAFHKNAFAIVFAKLPDTMHNEIFSSRVSSIQDPITGLSLRSSIYGMPDVSQIRVKLDVLFGVKTLDGNLAVRGWDATA